MKTYFQRAISNVIAHGDTDIFPFPIENHLFFDKREKTVELLQSLHTDFEGWLERFPPANEGALIPVGYLGFRWATQIDPLWNLYFLALVLSVAGKIEDNRLPALGNHVFSYRYKWQPEKSDLFDPNYNWRTFLERSLDYAKDSKFVIACDISEFYPRLGHHRLDNALRHIKPQNDAHKRIMVFLSNFSNTNSYGLPVGGPAARLLSELVLNQIDQLLLAEGIKFCRFADDFHIFVDDMKSAYSSLLFLSDKLLRNQGLQLQKSKTRIMSSAEFSATSPLQPGDELSDDEPLTLAEQSRGLLRLSLRFDAYSPTAREDYEALKSELEKIDIIGLLKREIGKSRVHIALAKKIVGAVKFLDPRQLEDAAVTLVNNAEILYPIFSVVLTVIKSVSDVLSQQTQKAIHSKILELIKSNSHVLAVDLNLAYAIRLLSCQHSHEAEAVLVRIYGTPTTPSFIRRDIILTMAKWQRWYWLSDLRTRFRTLSPAERRSFIIASYTLADEGKHWRQNTSGEFTPFEKLVHEWGSEKVQVSNWTIPL